MKVIEIYKNLIEYLSEIEVTELFEFPEDENSISMEYDILFNSKNTSAFLEEIDRIVFKIREDLIISFGNEVPSDELLNEIDQLVIKLSSQLIEKSTCYLPDTMTSDAFPIISNCLSEVIEKLHRHRNNWYKKYESLQDMPANLSLQWNENINKLVDIFYQLSEELKSGNKDPLIKTSKKNLAKFIVNNFVDKEGHNLKIQTVYTILKETRPEKRPSLDKRIKIMYLPM